MCNKTTEMIRQQLWYDVYLAHIKEVPTLESVKGANIALAEFDKAFQINVEDLDSYIAEKAKRQELLQYYQGLRYDKNISIINHSAFVCEISELKKLYFGENDFYDVSRVADVSQNLVYYAGKSKKGEDILVICKRNDKTTN